MVRTELVWTFSPKDIFPSPRMLEESRLRVEPGQVVAEIRPAIDPVPEEMIERLSALAEAEVIARSIATHTQASFQRRPRVNQYDEQGNCRTRVTVSDVLRVSVSAPNADVQVLGADGVVLRDTKAERIAREEDLVRSLAPKIATSKLIRDLAQIYRAAISDPADEFIHLYEIRDRLSKEYGSASQARKALGISKPEWDKIGIIANKLPTSVGRHRGEFLELRPPTVEELAEVREAARTLLVAAANQVR